MSYLVLARKYRPRTFHEVKGQEHTIRALSNALDSNRLHHAYLFSGTRGVGKTTLARILANCLNCEPGITSAPCGVCEACLQFGRGGFIDLIEVDAASRTGVDDTRQMLENVNFSPSIGRFKVYLIDEVHMLSGSSFNALLKTLEEPPEHAKFILATTDPKKIPVTVLSRCLQFHLRNIEPDEILKQLESILELENVSAEQEALRIIARAADGSMRDALSITDQAISHGSGQINAQDVSDMLGTARSNEIAQILQLLARGDRQELIAFTQSLSTRAVNYADLLAQLQRALHSIAIALVAGKIYDDELRPFTDVFSAEWVQVAYQILLMGGRDLQYAPDHRTGFEMTILRLLDFEPVTGYELNDKFDSESGSSNRRESTETEDKDHQKESIASKIEPVVPNAKGARSIEKKRDSPNLRTKNEPDETPQNADLDLGDSRNIAQPNKNQSVPPNDFFPKASTQSSELDWYEVVKKIALPYDLKDYLYRTELLSKEEHRIELRTDPSEGEYWNESRIKDVGNALSELLRDKYEVVVQFGSVESETPEQRIVRMESEKRQAQKRDKEQRRILARERRVAIEHEVQNNPVIQELKKSFGGEVIEIQIHNDER